MDYFSALKRSSAILDARFKQSQDILHSASKGTIRELIIKEVLRPFLPECYGLSGGECFDSNGKTSKQMDVVIYDKLYSYTIPYFDDFIQFPCESVYGNIEIKSKLNKDEFEKAINNVLSLKSLQRENSTPWTVNPNNKISIEGKPDEKSNYFFGIIFAYESVDYKTVLNYIKEIDLEPKYLPNAIILYSENVILLPMDKDSIYSTPLIDDFWGYEAIHCEDDTIALFILLVINYLRNTRLLAPNYVDLSNRIFTEYVGKQYVDIEKDPSCRKENCAILKSRFK